ncbi:hypothetical protein GCM10009555_010050 [Acrocarpospora macrocephala]|uniref:Uncharacterized protein n=1 Tax=Acrocarpospora macrocephala TaxID=150177 RepID=A0A5M3WWK1_9ACTN|nr:hypothetical protein Amac_041350 [Acrocarpospora macrocephala]
MRPAPAATRADDTPVPRDRPPANPRSAPCPGRPPPSPQPSQVGGGVTSGQDIGNTRRKIRGLPDGRRPGHRGVGKTRAARYLNAIRKVGLPDDLFADVAPKVLASWRARVAAEAPSHLRFHPHDIKVTLLAAYLYCRSREITDTFCSR